ncbi:hypothetical protein CFBP2118_04984 [Pseudomonas syringae pv. syringae]|nr:hypothetical protein CFBP2118_04984 [Pseudomonas syringae pv. syringae]
MYEVEHVLSANGVTPEGWMQPLEASWVNIQSRQNSQP